VIFRENSTGIYHEADETQSGYLTTCNLTFRPGDGVPVEGCFTTCIGCREPVAQVLTGPPERRTGKTSRPRWRTPRNVLTETIENTKFAHKEIVTALEWLQRGGEAQFVSDAVSHVHLAYRFLGEVLVAHGVIERGIVEEDD